MLCIFPFETEVYERAGMSATYVGHPLASEIPLEPNPASAKQRIKEILKLQTHALNGIIVAVLPGSRGSEIELIAPIFFKTMLKLAERLQGQSLHFVIPVATPRLREPLEALLKNTLEQNSNLDIHLIDGEADAVLESADVVLIASGTATLQAALWKKPMVISYKVPWLTAQIMKRQGYLPYVGLPNILCEEFVVPELLQDDATPSKLADALLVWLNNPSKVDQLKTRFAEMHETLRRPTGLLVAQAVMQTIAAGKKRVSP
jgi:lipid-A-disaccharide synthase